MTRALVALALFAAGALLASPYDHALATHGEPWHTTKGLPTPDNDPGGQSAGLIAADGPDISGDGRYVALTGPAPANFPGCASASCIVHEVIDTQTDELDPIAVAWDGTAQVNVFLPSASISDDGRYVVFGSEITLFDRVTREALPIAPEEPSANSSEVVISGDGRFVAFSSRHHYYPAPTLQCDAGPCSEVYVYDVAQEQIEVVSVSSAGNVADGESSSPALSTDGRFVAFPSSAGNLSDGETRCDGGQVFTCGDVYVHDRETNETTLVSVDTTGEAAGLSHSPDIAADGNIVVFESDANDLVPNDANASTDVFLRDIAAGETELVDVSADGAQAIGGQSNGVSVSADGRRVAFATDATTLDPDGPATCGATHLVCKDVFVRERDINQTYKVSVTMNGEHGDGRSDQARISADGRSVVFRSSADNLAPGVAGQYVLGEREGLAWGDLNCSGAIGTDDALSLLGDLSVAAAIAACPAVGDLVSVNDTQALWGDFNCDTSVSAADILPLLAHVAGLSPPHFDCPPVGADVTPLG